MKYYSIEGTPLKFHTFFRYISMPIGTVTGLIAVFNTIAAMTNLFYLVDILFYLIQTVACATAFVGFFKWKPYAWYAVMVYLANTLVYYLVLLLVHVIFGTGNIAYDVGTILGASIVAILIFTYYNKRKPLFFGGAQTAAVTDFSATERSCPGCGASLPDAGGFCPNCGRYLY